VAWETEGKVCLLRGAIGSRRLAIHLGWEDTHAPFAVPRKVAPDISIASCCNTCIGRRSSLDPMRIFGSQDPTKYR
jgi:hypothetical protein